MAMLVYHRVMVNKRASLCVWSSVSRPMTCPFGNTQLDPLGCHGGKCPCALMVITPRCRHGNSRYVKQSHRPSIPNMKYHAPFWTGQVSKPFVFLAKKNRFPKLLIGEKKPTRKQDERLGFIPRKFPNVVSPNFLKADRMSIPQNHVISL